MKIMVEKKYFETRKHKSQHVADCMYSAKHTLIYTHMPRHLVLSLTAL